MIRRDITNQFGYICPTENEAIRNADAKPERERKPSRGVMREEDIKAMDKGRNPFAAFVEAETEEYKQELKRARALKATIVAMASLAEYECLMRFAFRDKRTGKVYNHDEL